MHGIAASEASGVLFVSPAQLYLDRRQSAMQIKF
jgi:hypothetical protein